VKVKQLILKIDENSEFVGESIRDLESSNCEREDDQYS